ncbi:MAG: molybdopterin converting factor subunit 1 [Rhodocyclaceae bacterium]|jgi:molybdopterin synthase sulfur carrier subunit|nr:molybdopterin converting factor subunit 1 [Rhodocyclaceae bacterium]
MTLNILYFAGLREAIGTGRESIAMPADTSTVGALREHLARLDEQHAMLRSTKNLRVAVNQKMLGMDAAIADGDEIAFFPPVTGG